MKEEKVHVYRTMNQSYFKEITIIFPGFDKMCYELKCPFQKNYFKFLICFTTKRHVAQYIILGLYNIKCS